MAGLIGTLVTYRDDVNTDFNELKDTGLYRYNANIANAPSTDDGFLVVLNHNNDIIIQFAMTNKKIWYERNKWYTNAWDGWKKH